MPFQSEKQRRFLHANHPEIAKRWERDYANGGILDIDASEEIIDDDGNDIELTDYNAAFDDPNDLSTGVRTLFMKKGGNVRLGPHTATDLLAKKNPDGTRSKYQPPGGGATSLGSGRDYSGSDRGPRDDPDRHGPTTTTTTTSTGGDGYQDRIIEVQERNRKQALKDLVATGPGSDVEKYDSYEQMLQDKYPGQGADAEKQHFNIQKSKVILNKARDDWEEVRNSMNEKYKKKVGRKIIGGLLGMGVTFGIGDIIGVMIDGFKTNKAKQEFIGAIKNQIANYTTLGMPVHSPHTDTLIQTLNQEILDLTQRPDEDDPKHDPVPIYDSRTGAVSEEYAQGYYGMSNLEKIRAGQAKYADYMEKIEQEKLMREQPFGANSGGLANLFRVKNQY